MKPYSRIEIFLLAVILAAGAFLRFTGLADLSYHNDELSILIRCQYDSFGEFLEFGAISVHPYFFQIGMWLWTQVAGFEPLMVRLPFALMSIGSIFLTWVVCRRWFGKTSALLAAAAMAFLAFPLYYGQIARPYAPGLFLCLLATIFWDKWLQEEGKKWWQLIAFVLISSLASGMHYFATLYIGLLISAGFFFLRGKMWTKYMLGLIAFLLLYIPQLLKLKRDLGRGGLDWLGPPGIDWLPNLMGSIFNGSGLLALVVLVVCLVALGNSWGRIKFQRGLWLSLLLFFGTFLIGFFYSLLRKPVLQESYMLFSLPLFFGLLFAGFGQYRIAFKQILLTLGLSIVFLLHTTLAFRYYQVPQHSDYKRISEQIAAAQKQYGSFGLEGFFQTNSPAYVDFCLNLYGNGSFPMVGYELNKYGAINHLGAVLSSTDAQFFFNTRIKTGPDIRPMILDFFPIIRQYSTEEKRYFQLYEKLFPGDTVFHQSTTHEMLLSGQCYEGQYQFSADCIFSTSPMQPFSGGLNVPLSETGFDETDRMVVSAQVRNLSLDENAKLGILITQGESNNRWLEIPLIWYDFAGTDWVNITGEYSMMDFPQDAEVKVFLFSPAGMNVLMKNPELSILRNAH